METKQKAHITLGTWQVGTQNAAKVDGFRFNRIPISGSGQAIAAVWNGSPDRAISFSNGEANARAIAALPDLIKALSRIVDCAEKEIKAGNLDSSCDACIKLAKAALRKAGVL